MDRKPHRRRWTSPEQEEEEEPSPTPPPNGPELPELKQLDDSFNKPKSLGTAADALQVHALWRQLKNRTVNDPDVQAAKKYAQAAPTDLEKRKRLRTYYEVYYQRMSALASTPELKVALQALKDTHQGYVGSATGATIADTRVFWHAVADANKHAFQEKDQRETQEAESAQVTSGFPGVRRRRLRPVDLHRCNAGTRVCQVPNIAKCRAMLDLAKILLAVRAAVF